MIKTVFSLVSSLLTGLVVQEVLRSRRRLMASVALGGAAFVFVMASILLGAIEIALQLDRAGVVSRSPLLGVAVGFLAAGALCALLARIVFPKPQIAEVFAGLDGASINALVGQFSQGFNAGMAAPEGTAPTPVVN